MRGLYVHIPFCIKKCAYCDFVSYENCFNLENDYINALKKEFCHYKGEAVDTVFIGGGTPTALKTESLTLLLDAIFENFEVLKNAEITVECNPKTADRKKLSALVKHGVNRLSIGVQSLDDKVLKTIGRIHSSNDAKNIIYGANEVGFKNISADIMFGLPNQTVKILEKTIDELCKLPLSHISCYGLILEEGTPLYKKVNEGELSLPDEDTEFKMYESAVLRLKEHGFNRYEISNFAKENKCSFHNIKYWECEEYIGCGAAAHSYYNGERFSRAEKLSDYIKNPLEKVDAVTLTEDDKKSEFMMLGLRMDKGILAHEYKKRFMEDPIEKYKKIIEKYEKAELLVCDGKRIYLTDKGIYLSNTVLCEFM